MEIIVGINLGFLLLTVIVSFFLFSTKFIATTTKNLESRQNVNDYFFRLGSMLKKSDSYYKDVNMSFFMISNGGAKRSNDRHAMGMFS